MNKFDKWLLVFLSYLVLVIVGLQSWGTWQAHQECAKHNIAKAMFILPNKMYCVKNVTVQRMAGNEQIVITTEYLMPVEIWNENEVEGPIL